MEPPVIRHLFTQRNGNRHLRHDGCAAAANQAAVNQRRLTALVRCGNGRTHAGTARADNQHIGFKVLNMSRTHAAPK